MKLSKKQRDSMNKFLDAQSELLKAFPDESVEADEDGWRPTIISYEREHDKCRDELITLADEYWNSDEGIVQSTVWEEED